jgi:hypothetical protein
MLREESQILNNANTQDLGHLLQSWIGTGANQPIARRNWKEVVGQDRIKQLASRAGIRRPSPAPPCRVFCPRLSRRLRRKENCEAA